MKFLERTINEAENIPAEVVEGITTNELEAFDSIDSPDKIPYHLLEASNGRSVTRKYKSIRLSEVDGCCPREYILGNLLNLQYVDYARFSNLWQMDMGSAMHWHVQNSPTYFGDKLVGWWRCRACGFTRRFGIRPKEPCEQCRAHPRVTEYKEYMFRISDPFAVVGKVDLILRVAPRVYRFGEVKTCSEDKSGPDGAHVAQLASYTYFSRFDDQLPITIDRSKSYLFYFNKKFNWKSPVKAFVIKPTEKLMAPIIDKVSAVTEGMNTGVLLPPLQKCISGAFKKGRAKNCGISMECQKHFDRGITNVRLLRE